MSEPKASPPRLSFDEFKMYYESAERVTERRLDMNKWNYSIMVATLLAAGAVLTWATSRPANMFVGVVGVLMLSAMAMLHCTYWIRQIDDFKALNTAKFDILNEMAPLVEFAVDGSTSPVRSYEPFEREWRSLSARRAVQKIKRSSLPNLIALKSSSAEYFIPKAFRLLFVLILAGALIFGSTNYRQVIHHMSPFDGVTTEQGGIK